eukprot:1843058-Heterocapsa_arctica.AAC.1
MVVIDLQQRMPLEEKAPSDGGESAAFEPRTTDMERIVDHRELPDSRTCVPRNDYGSPAEMTIMCKDSKGCFTCAAFKTTQSFKDETFDTKNSNI